MYSLEPANFQDYRDFLNFRFDSLKEKNKNFTLQVCANKSGLSKSHIQFILKKQRHIALDKFPQLAKALKISSEEEYFIYLMICKNSSQNKTVKSHFESIMKRIRSQHLEVDEVKALVSNTNVYHDQTLAILQSVVRLKDFQEDPKWIASILELDNVNETKIIEGLAYLESIEAIKRDKDGRLKSTDYDVFYADPYDQNGFNIYTKAAKFTAKLMEEPHKYCPSVYSSMSLAMDEENLLETEKLMVELHHKICDLAKKSKNPTAIAYVGNFFVTLARLKQN